jgi:AbrB family looped-hinge helix DNA binding protein
METITSSKGQIVIPAKIRRKLGIKEGTPIQIDVDELNRRIILTPVTPDYVRSLRGKYKDQGLMEALRDEKKQEKEY